MTTGNYGGEPEFDEQIVEDYRRASAEDFTRPPSASLRQAPKEAPFRWPGIDQRRDTVALQRDELRQAVEGHADEEKHEAPARAAQWVLELVDGPLLAMPSRDVIVGRKPGTIPGCTQLAVEDTGRTLSKSHVRLTLEGERWVVEDLGSTNGTALIETGEDGQVTERLLAAGDPAYASDVFRIGTLRVRLRPIIVQ